MTPKSPLAQKIGARVNLLKLEELLPKLKKLGFYVIARHVLFYDPKLARHLSALPTEKEPQRWVSQLTSASKCTISQSPKKPHRWGLTRFSLIIFAGPMAGRISPSMPSATTLSNSFYDVSISD
jgi:hypothetical protein